ncbi:hypothetical protein CM15mP43_04560 [bacterium]|nr:MAG: hypothetical protein CM15mP43_04560 [bacterium]
MKNGGVIQTLSNEIKIKCLPTNIPNVIEINISDLNIGDTLRVKDIKPMDGIEILSNPESTIISILAPRLVVETATTDTMKVLNLCQMIILSKRKYRGLIIKSLV